MKNFKKTLAIFLAALMMVSAFAAYSVFATMTDGENTPAPAAEPALASEPAPVAETGNTGTATAGWAEETRNGVTAYYVDDLDDFKAFHDNSSANSWYNQKTVIITADLDMTKASWAWSQVTYFHGTLDGQGHTLNLVLTAPMYSRIGIPNDATAYTASFNNLNFTGTATGAGNMAAIVFQTYNKSTLNFTDVDIAMTVTGTSNVAAFLSRANCPGVSVNIENCVNNSTVIAKDISNAGGFVATVENGTVLKMNDCVFTGTVNNPGTKNGKRFGGFVGMVGRISSTTQIGTVEMTDCVYMGDMTGLINTESAAMVAGMAGNLTMNRCVAITKDKSPVDFSVLVTTRDKDTANKYTINLNDCYIATNNEPAYDTTTNATNHTVNIKYNGVAADSVKNIGAELTAANFKAVCPTLAANGWVATTATVEYGKDLAATVIVPAKLAATLELTAAASPVDATDWFVKDNGETVAVRFVGTIKEDAAHLAKYDNVGMKMTITLKGDTDTVLIDGKKYYSASVYEAITFEGRYVKAEDGEYLFAVNMGGFKKDASYEVTFVSFATYDGVEIYDLEGATTISVVNGAIVKA